MDNARRVPRRFCGGGAVLGVSTQESMALRTKVYGGRDEVASEHLLDCTSDTGLFDDLP